MVKRPAAIGVLFLLAALIGCQTGPAPSATRSSSHAKAKLSELGLSSVAYLGLSKSAVADETALRIMQPVVESHLLANPPYFVLLPPAEIEMHVKREGAEALYNDVLSHWRDNKKVDPLKVRDFCDALGVDAILVGTIDEWMQVRATLDMNEPAYTKVAASLRLYLPGQGRPSWRKKESHAIETLAFEQEQDSQEAYPGSSGASRSRDLGRLRSVAGDPPRFEDVVPEVAAALAKALIEG